MTMNRFSLARQAISTTWSSFSAEPWSMAFITASSSDSSSLKLISIGTLASSAMPITNFLASGMDLMVQGMVILRTSSMALSTGAFVNQLLHHSSGETDLVTVDDVRPDVAAVGFQDVLGEG